MEKLSVFITTDNNEHMSHACLESVEWANEIVLLDLFTNERTLDVAREFGCTIHQHEFSATAARSSSLSSTHPTGEG